jgi:(2Fe-2S) ferredoxin
MGRHCNAAGRAKPLYDSLTAALGEPADFTQRHKLVRWEVANCLSNCDIGPNLVFYPEGEWYHYTDLSHLTEIIARYHAAESQWSQEDGS